MPMDYQSKYLALTKKKLTQLLNNEAGEIFLFGSRATGKNSSRSDIDIGFDGMKRETFARVEREFRNYLEDSLIPYDVDLVYLPDTNENFRKEAEKGKITWIRN